MCVSPPRTFVLVPASPLRVGLFWSCWHGCWLSGSDAVGSPQHVRHYTRPHGSHRHMSTSVDDSIIGTPDDEDTCCTDDEEGSADDDDGTFDSFPAALE